MEPDQFTLISVGLIRYSCGHILDPHEPIPTQFGLWMFFIMLHRYMVSKTLKSKKKGFCDVIASVLYILKSDHAPGIVLHVPCFLHKIISCTRECFWRSIITQKSQSVRPASCPTFEGTVPLYGLSKVKKWDSPTFWKFQ